MNHPSAKGIEEDISEWLRGEVCAEIEDLIASPIIDPGHSDAENHAYLSWFVKHFVSSDPASTLIGDETLFADGSSDAGIDIFVEQHVDDESRFDVYQVSRPALDKLRAGSRSRRQAKIASDLRQLRNSLTERKLKKRRYNTTAVNALAKINRAIEVAQESSGRVVVINVRPMTLNKVSLEDLEEMRLLQTEAQEEWSTEKVKWTIHEVRDAEILHAEHKRRTHSKKLPDRLKLHYEDQVACAARSKGPYLGFVKAIDVIDAYEKWGPALLDSNLRYSLRTSRNNTNVNARIAQELERVAGFKRFHVKNNGLVMTCNECIIHDKAKYLELVEPQLINGGQTIDTLHHAHRELAAIPEAKRTSEERERLICYNSLLLPIKVVRTDQKLDSDTIAIASNTQNELSPRTMLSSRPEMTALRRSMANIIPHPWYCETKDGEWEAVSVGKKEYFQSRTGGKSARDFRTGGGLVRRVSNVDLGVSLLAFLGFVDKAKASFLFQADAFDRVFGSNPSNESWPVLTKKRLEWGGQELVSLFDDSRADAPLLLLAWFSWEFWRKWTFTETGQKIQAFEEAGRRDAAFLQYKKLEEWDVPQDICVALLKREDTCYWPEQIAKSAYLVLVYQTMRILYRRYGRLTNDTCLRIINLPDYAQLFEGRSASVLGDPRSRKLDAGPLATIGKVLLYACRRLWESDAERIRNMSSRQQGLLAEEWVTRLSAHADWVSDKIGAYSWRQSVGLDPDAEVPSTVAGLEQLLPPLSLGEPK